MTVAIAIVCKTPAPGQSKTRLSPPLKPEDCAAISACFIEDLARTIEALTAAADVAGVALYTPTGSEGPLIRLLPPTFAIVPQRGDGFGERLLHGVEDLLSRFTGAILVNSDSPTLPTAILSAAVAAVQSGDKVVLSPALDGGYTLIGLSQVHRGLFADIPWSTADVHRLTVARAESLGLPVVNLPGWYDVDDAVSLKLLRSELFGSGLDFTELSGAPAPATTAFLRQLEQAELPH